MRSKVMSFRVRRSGSFRVRKLHGSLLHTKHRPIAPHTTSPVCNLHGYRKETYPSPAPGDLALGSEDETARHQDKLSYPVWQFSNSKQGPTVHQRRYSNSKLYVAMGANATPLGRRLKISTRQPLPDQNNQLWSTGQ